MRYRVGRVRSATHIHVFIGRKADIRLLLNPKRTGECLFIGRKAQNKANFLTTNNEGLTTITHYELLWENAALKTAVEI